MLSRVVMDTTILVSAIRSRNGAAAAVLQIVLDGEVQLLMDYSISCEYREVALRPEHTSGSHFSIDEINHILNTLEKLAESVHIEERHRPLSIDPEDDRVLDVAINGDAHLIVTANTKHFAEPAHRFGIEVVDAKTLLFRIRDGR